MKTYEELKDDFSFLDDWEERYRYIIDLGRHLPLMDAALKTEETLVPGCTSRVWMISTVTKDAPPLIHFVADSDAHIVRGLIGVLFILFSGKTAQEILAIDIHDVFQTLGLEDHISPNRRNGFFSMVGRIRSTAQGLLLRENEAERNT